MALEDESVGAATEGAGTFLLQLLGPLRITAANGEPVPALGAGKSLAILAYIAVRGDTRRDDLISVLWGDVPEANARNAFRQSLHRLRSALGNHVLSFGRDEVAIAANRRITVDRDTFLEACDLGNCEVAVASYGGEFLEGFETGESAFDRWADSERVRLRSRFEECLFAAAKQAAAAGRIVEAVQFAERLVGVAPYDENAAVCQANTLVAAGRPGQALTAIRQFAARLTDDLDVQVSPAVRSLTDRLEKGSDSIRAHASSSSRAGERVTLSAFVGRQAEVSRLIGMLDRLKAGRGGTMLVEGEKGLGKSRLLDEFSERTKRIGGVLVLRGREIGNGGVVAYAAVAEALRPIVRAAGVSGASRHLLAEAARLLPELRDSFDLPTVSALEDETGRLRLFEGVAAVIDAAAYEKPVCVILDDIQHSSASTLDLITYLSQRLRESPVLLIAAYRPDRSASQSIDRIRHLTADNGSADDWRIALVPLSDADVRLLVEETLRRAPTALPLDIDRIVAHSRGIPFDAIALARRASVRGLGDELPVAMRDVLWSRLQAASAAQRRVFFACSLFQRRAALRLLAAAAHLPESATWDAAQELVRVGLLSELDDGFVIAHDSAATFLVESSGLSGRSLLAGWAADALAEEDGIADAELAALYAVAGRGRDAFVRARAGAFAASAMGAATEVVRLLEIALTFAPDQAARREIDSLLGAFGRGHLALPPVASPEPAVTGPAEVPPIEESSGAPDDPAFAGEPDVVVEPLDEPVNPAAASARPRLASTRQWIVSVAISLVIILAGYFARRAVITRLDRSGAPDTLFLVERDSKGQNQVRAVASAERSDGTTLVSVAREALGPAWVDSLRAPFAGALVSPDGMRVAMERVTPTGDDLLVVSANRHDTTIVQPGARNGVPLGWSPDSHALLVQRTRTLDDGSLDSDLYVCWIGAQRDVPIDSVSARAVTEAKWSPTGVWVAWAARIGASRKRRIFISRPDGSDVRSVAGSAADDYNIDWSPDGSLIAFTSTRSGGRRLYVYDLDDNRLWPISDRDGEDDARFSPDGRLIAFESTRDGDRAIYLRPALGGSPRRVTPTGRQLSIAAWRGGGATYVDRLRIVGESSVDLGDSVRLGWVAITPSGASVSNSQVRFKVLDGLVVQADTDRSAAIQLVGVRAGAGRVVASIPGWRSDTLTVLVSSAQSFHVDDDFARASLGDQWMSLGRPAPYIGRMPGSSQRALFPNGGLEWDSGILLRSTLQLRAGVRAEARVTAPFDGRPSATRFTIAFVLAVPQAVIDSVAPRFTTVVGAQWDGAAGNLTYSVGQESSSEPAASLSGATSHVISIVVHRDVVTFYVDGQTRWRSSLKYLGDGSGTPVQLWIGGRATAESVAVSRVVVELAGKTTAAR